MGDNVPPILTVTSANWGSASHVRRRKFRYLISASHHITRFLGRRLPAVFPFVFVLGYPKSGTSWVCQLVSDYVQLPFPQNSLLPIGFPAVVHGHETYQKTASATHPRTIYVVRDGRDALVSLYFHLRARRQQQSLRPLATVVPTPNQTDLVATRQAVEKFVLDQLRRPFASNVPWGDHARSYFDASDHHSVLVRYEDLLQDGVTTLMRTISEITGEPADPERARRSVERFSFARQTGGVAGREDPTSYLRKGEAGDWRNYFTRRAAEAFADRCGEMLIAAGYEQNDDWLNGVVPRAAA